MYGETIFDVSLNSLRKSILQSTALTIEAKNVLLRMVDFLIRSKDGFKALHRSLFYITGVYYCISHRLTGIQYVSYIVSFF